MGDGIWYTRLIMNEEEDACKYLAGMAWVAEVIYFICRWLGGNDNYSQGVRVARLNKQQAQFLAS